MDGSRRLPPRTRPTLDLASAQNTASVFYGPAQLGLCWGRFDLRALALIGRAQDPAPRKNRQSVLFGFEQIGCGKPGACLSRGSDPALKWGHS
jgi:hypothetical protein